MTLLYGNYECGFISLDSRWLLMHVKISCFGDVFNLDLKFLFAEGIWGTFITCYNISLGI